MLQTEKKREEINSCDLNVLSRICLDFVSCIEFVLFRLCPCLDLSLTPKELKQKRRALK